MFASPTSLRENASELLEEESQPTQAAMRRLRYLHDKDLRRTSLLGIKYFCNQRSNTPLNIHMLLLMCQSPGDLKEDRSFLVASASDGNLQHMLLFHGMQEAKEKVLGVTFNQKTFHSIM